MTQVLNDTSLDTSGLYPYISQHLLLTKIPPVYRESVKVSGMIEEDHEWTEVTKDKDGNPHLELNPDMWNNLEKRKEKYALNASQPLELCTYLFHDLTSSPNSFVVPPHVTVELELHPAPPRKTIIVDRPGVVDPVVVIHNATVIVPRVTPAHSIPRAISHQYMKLRCQPVYIPTRTTNYHGLISFSGPVPSRLTLQFISMKAWDGDFISNMFNSHHRNVANISFNIGGKHHPVSPILADFEEGRISEMYLRTCESLRFSLDRTRLTMPSLEEYAERRFMFTIDISEDYSTDASWTTGQDDVGSVALSLHFNKPTTEQLVALLISENVATLKISQAGEVDLEG